MPERDSMTVIYRPRDVVRGVMAEHRADLAAGAAMGGPWLALIEAMELLIERGLPEHAFHLWAIHNLRSRDMDRGDTAAHDRLMEAYKAEPIFGSLVAYHTGQSNPDTPLSN
jgi:hypothetical protein